MISKWYRVNRKRPCAICNRIDWCGYTDDGAACCMRVESDHPTRNGGWLHKTDSAISYVPPVVRRPAIEDNPLDATGMWFQWFTRTTNNCLDGLGQSLAVDTDALRSIGCAWAPPHNAWAFPMKDATGNVIGIRLRNERGEKWAVKGSRQGLFIPTQYPFTSDGTLWLCEGPTDLAAALTLGLTAIARPACLGQENLLLSYVRASNARRLVIVTDNDEPGLRGATKLRGLLSILSCIWLPPCKDIREFLTLGGTRTMIEAAIKDTVWTKPRDIAA